MRLRILSIPAGLMGIALAIVFFKIYGMFTRPDVPRPIAIVVDQFAPGVKIGDKVSDVRHAVAAMTYVPHLGYVGLPDKRPGGNLPDGNRIDFAQVRLLLDEETRSQPHPNPAKARIDAVEIVSIDPGASDLNNVFFMLFRRKPREGCLRTSEAGRVRDVKIFATPNERGGLAVISDYVAGPYDRSRGPMITSVIAFVGKFDGGWTLRGNYTDATCTIALQQEQ